MTSAARPYGTPTWASAPHQGGALGRAGSWATPPVSLAMQGSVEAAELDQGADGRVDGRDPQLKAPPPSPHLQPGEAVNHERPFTWWGGQAASDPQVTGWAAHLCIACDGTKVAHACSDERNLKE